jgi:hypothetical protein
MSEVIARGSAQGKLHRVMALPDLGKKVTYLDELVFRDQAGLHQEYLGRLSSMHRLSKQAFLV